MNEVLQCLLQRRSVKSYLDKQVSEEDLNQILEAGKYAPTGRGAQSPIFVVVQNPETVKKLSRMNAAVMGASGDPFYGAPTVVVVLADKNVSTWVEDGSLAMGNMMNAAFALGVDSCWIHRAREVFESEEGKELLKQWGIGENYGGVGNCILGHRAQDPAPRKPRKEKFVYRV